MGNNMDPITEEEEIIERLREEYLSDRPEAEKEAILELIADAKIRQFKLRITLMQEETNGSTRTEIQTPPETTSEEAACNLCH